MALSLDSTLAAALDSASRKPIVNIVSVASDNSSLNVSQYLLADSDISIARSTIDDRPHRLEFSCSHGHLFDPYNVNSGLNQTFIKGRKLVVKWGENIDGIDYWQNAGTFYVSEIQLAYKRGEYTEINVSAEDIRSFWAIKHIYATDYYENSFPEDIISGLITSNTDWTSSDIDLPTFDKRVLVEYQRTDITLLEALQEVCERFSYYLTITVDNKVSARKISDSNTVDHVYSDTTKLLKFEPDDSYSDFTNRVTVQGQERTKITVYYPEERVAQLSGTIGWYGGTENHDVHYSVDDSRICVNPRLAVIKSATSLAFALEMGDPIACFEAGDITESISYVDPNNHYCTVTIQGPNCIPLLIETGAAMYASSFIPDGVVEPSGYSGYTIRLGSFLSSMFGLGMCSIISAYATYQYEVWATPTGRVRRSVQGTADDTSFQQEIGRINEKKFEDPLCYSVDDCTFVAQNELMIARLQRNRVKLSKIAHLQDEEGDTIKVKHPYTGADTTLFITDLKRTYRKPSTSNSDGGFFDEAEGWIVG